MGEFLAEDQQPRETGSVAVVTERSSAVVTGSRSATVVASAALVILSIFSFLRFRHWDFDDSFIVYRVVRNLLAGNGWVYNVGEPLNASTSVLNTISVAAAAYVTGDIPLASHLLASFWIFAASTLTLFLVRREAGLIASLVAAGGVWYVLSYSCSWRLRWHSLL